MTLMPSFDPIIVILPMLLIVGEFVEIGRVSG